MACMLQQVVAVLLRTELLSQLVNWLVAARIAEIAICRGVIYPCWPEQLARRRRRRPVKSLYGASPPIRIQRALRVDTLSFPLRF